MSDSRPAVPDQTFDLVVVGSGTGLAAALAAHDLGLSTLVVEKTERVGGSTALSGGAFWIPGNSIIEDGGGDDSLERAAIYLEDIVGDTTDASRWQNYLRHGRETVDLLRRVTRLKFMWSKGYSDYHSDRPGGSAVGRTCESRPFDLALLGEHRGELRRAGMAPPIPMPITGVDYRVMNLMGTVPQRSFPRAIRRVGQGLVGKWMGKEYAAGGQALAGGLYDAVLRAGIPVWRETELTDLVTETVDGTERVTGAVLVRDGQDVTVGARRGVVLSAGGFDHDMARRHEHQLDSLGEWSLGSPGNVGDSLDVTEKLGAGTALLDQAWWFPAIAPLPGGKPKVMLAERALPGTFMVGGTGKRFINESTDYMSFGQEVLRRAKSGDPVGQIWIVFDQKYRNSYVFGGELFPRMEIPESWYEAGNAVRADSMEELAAKTGMADLAETGRKFNAMAEAGTDDEFARGATAYDRYYGDPSHGPNPNLRPLDKGPYYAVKVVLSDLGTCGGLTADDQARVLRTDGSVIEGLYAIGNSAANAFGDKYPGAGATIGQGLVYGYIAAQHAAGRSKD